MTKLNKLLQVKDWHTINYPNKKVGSAEIVKTKYNPGTYLMEGVDGYYFWENKKDIPITELRINGEVVMLDDPLHWHGMRLLAEASYGKVFVGGLGLGLVLHHLLNNPKVTQIDVYELNKDVIDLVAPLLPKNNKIWIFNGDILTEPWRKKEYDVIINDIWVKDHTGKFEAAGTKEKWNGQQLNDCLLRTTINNPKTKVFIWGVRDREHNPAVTIDLDERYLKLVESMRE